MSLFVGTNHSCYHYTSLHVFLSPQPVDSPKDSMLIEGFGFGVRQLGSNPPPTHSIWVILTLGKIINLSKSQCSHLHNKGNNTYLSRSFKELNKTLYIQHQAQYLSLTNSSINSDSYHKRYYSFLTPII